MRKERGELSNLVILPNVRSYRPISETPDQTSFQALLGIKPKPKYGINISLEINRGHASHLLDTLVAFLAKKPTNKNNIRKGDIIYLSNQKLRDEALNYLEENFGPSEFPEEFERYQFRNKL